MYFKINYRALVLIPKRNQLQSSLLPIKVLFLWPHQESAFWKEMEASKLMSELRSCLRIIFQIYEEWLLGDWSCLGRPLWARELQRVKSEAIVRACFSKRDLSRDRMLLIIGGRLSPLQQLKLKLTRQREVINCLARKEFMMLSKP